jgi:hypothetical protein
LRLRSIKVTSKPKALTARYVRPKQRSWKIDLGRLTLETHLLGRTEGQYSELSLTELCHFKFALERPIGIERAVQLASRVEDLMILLTDSRRGLDFPVLRHRRRSTAVQLYYPRFERSSDSVEWMNCWARFPLIAELFGSIVENWFNKHEFFGPGFHLYLGNRRQRQLYPEHRFGSFVWGLESLDRRMPSRKVNTALQEKINRIFAEPLSNKDRKWLEGQLAHAHEPSLAVRLSDIFNPFRDIFPAACCALMMGHEQLYPQKP